MLFLREFTRKVTATRKAFPILYRSRFLVGSRNEELDVTDVSWLSPSGAEMSSEQWQDGNVRSFGMLLDGRAQELASSVVVRMRRCFLSIMPFRCGKISRFPRCLMKQAGWD